MKNASSKIFNELYNYELKASSFKVFTYFSSVCGWWKERKSVKLETIARRCNISKNTAQRCINELIEKGLIIKTECYMGYRRTTNQYSVKKLTGKFTLIERNLFYAIKDNSAFMLFCEINKHRIHSFMAFPSLKQLKEATHMSKTTIIAKVKYLQEHGFLHKERYTSIYGDFGHNNHKLFKLAFRVFLLLYVAAAEKLNQLIHAIKNSAVYKAFDKSILNIYMVIFIIIAVLIQPIYLNEVDTC